MVHIEVQLKEGDKEPEQHLDEGEHIERIVVPISELYTRLQGTSSQNLSLALYFGNQLAFPTRVLQRGGEDRGCQVSSSSTCGRLHHLELTVAVGSSTGLWGCTGASVWVSKADSLLISEDFVKQGFVPDIYVAFVAYGWYWGSKVLEEDSERQNSASAASLDYPAK